MPQWPAADRLEAEASAVTALVLDPVFERHRTEPGHPEAPARIRILRQTLAPEAASCLTIQPRAATLEEVALAHHPRYVEAVLRQIEEGVEELAGGDVSVSRESGHIALLAAGSGINPESSPRGKRIATLVA